MRACVEEHSWELRRRYGSSLDCALEDACRAGSKAAIQFLLSSKALQRLRSRGYGGAFFWAARRGERDILKQLFSSFGFHSDDKRVPHLLLDALAGASSPERRIEQNILEELFEQSGNGDAYQGTDDFVVAANALIKRPDVVAIGQEHKLRGTRVIDDGTGERETTPSDDSDEDRKAGQPNDEVPEDCVIRPNGFILRSNQKTEHENFFDLFEDACKYRTKTHSMFNLIAAYHRMPGCAFSQISFQPALAEAAVGNSPGKLLYFLASFGCAVGDTIETIMEQQRLANFQLLVKHGLDVNMAPHRIRPPPIG